MLLPHKILLSCNFLPAHMISSLLKKYRIALIYGGTSPENFCSVESAIPVYLALCKANHQVVVYFVRPDGVWFELPNGPCIDPFIQSINDDPVPKKYSILEIFHRWHHLKFDVIFPVIHGWLGEDGRIASLCEWLRIPCVGPGSLASAISLDKKLLKQILISENLPTLSFITFSVDNYALSREFFLEKIKSDIGFPCIFKPSHGGSSIGMTLVDSADQINLAVAEISKYNYLHVLVEKYIDAIDIEVGVVGNSTIKVGVPIEMIHSGRVYNFNDKCATDEKRIPAALPLQVREHIQTMAAEIYELINCRGMARIDFLVASNNFKIFVNEINTVPYLVGDSSFISSLATSHALTYLAILEEIIELALQPENHLHVVFGGKNN